MRIVFDANDLVSAAIAPGPSHRVVQAVTLSREHDVIVCPALFEEVEDVLSRPRLLKRVGHDQARRYVGDLRILTTRVPDPIDVGTHTRAPDDDYLVALAREHSADYIVTGDRDRLEWLEQRPPVVTPAAFETLLTALE